MTKKDFMPNSNYILMLQGHMNPENSKDDDIIQSLKAMFRKAGLDYNNEEEIIEFAENLPEFAIKELEKKRL